MNDYQKDFSQISATLSASIIGMIESHKIVLDLMCKQNGHTQLTADCLFNTTMLDILKRFPTLQDGEE